MSLAFKLNCKLQRTKTDPLIDEVEVYKTGGGWERVLSVSIPASNLTIKTTKEQPFRYTTAIFQN